MRQPPEEAPARSHDRDVLASSLSALEERLDGVTLVVALHDHSADEFVVAGVRDGAELGLERGKTVPLDASLCLHMAAGRAPELCNDVPREPVYRERADRLEMPIRSYLGVPLETGDGTRVGSLCALDLGSGRFRAVDHEAMSLEAERLAGHLAQSPGGLEDALRALASEDAPKPDRRLRGTALRRSAPFVAAIGLAFATLPLSAYEAVSLVEVGLAAALTVAILGSVAIVPWSRFRLGVRMAPAYALFLVAVLLREAAGGAASGFAVLVLLPVLWVALQGTRRELWGAIAGVAVAMLGPILLVGAPAYPPTEWRRALLFIVVAAIAGRAVEAMVRRSRRRAEQLAEGGRELRASEEQKEAILHAAGEGIVGIDAAGLATFANPVAASLTGYEPVELVGLAVSKLFEALDTGTGSPVTATLADGCVRTGTSEPLRRKDGSTFPAEYTVRAMRRRGRVAGAVLTFRDATERIQADRVKDEFLAMVSHELRTPLASTIGYLDLALDDTDGGEPIDPERRGYLEVAERNAKRLLRLVGDLLFVAQLESGQLPLTPGPLDLGRTVAEAVGRFGDKAERLSIDLVLDADPLPVGTGDEERIGQVLDNLISNGLKYTPSGGRVAVRLRHSDGNAVIEVEDSGIGIPAEDHGRLFQRFFRASTATERHIEGVGLGLMIVKAIVEGHGGTISLRSAEGEGSTFRAELPILARVETPGVEARSGA